MNTFSAGAMIRFGWETFKKRAWFFVGVALLIGILSAIAASIGSSFGNHGAAQGIGSIINFLLGSLIGLGMTAFFLKAHDSLDAAESNDLWHPQPFLKYLAVRLLIGVVIVLGLILLIVPGVIAALMFIFAPYIVVDKGLGPVEAMKESKRITDGHKWQLFGLVLILGLLNILGAIALVVGLLVSIPVSALALTHAYRTLEHAAGEVVPVPAV